MSFSIIIYCQESLWRQNKKDVAGGIPPSPSSHHTSISLWAKVLVRGWTKETRQCHQCHHPGATCLRISVLLTTDQSVSNSVVPNLVDRVFYCFPSKSVKCWHPFCTYNKERGGRQPWKWGGKKSVFKIWNLQSVIFLSSVWKIISGTSAHPQDLMGELLLPLVIFLLNIFHSLEASTCV